MIGFLIIPAYLVVHALIGSAMGAPENAPRNPPAPVVVEVPDYTPCADKTTGYLDTRCMSAVELAFSKR